MGGVCAPSALAGGEPAWWTHGGKQSLLAVRGVQQVCLPVEV